MAKETSGVRHRRRRSWLMSDVQRKRRAFEDDVERGYSGSDPRLVKRPEQLFDDIEEEEERR